MEMRSLGATGLTVSRLGLGLAALGRPGYINLAHAQDLQQNYDPAAMCERTAAVLDAAWHGGVRYFDAARSYGRAEEFLGAWLDRRKVQPGQAVVGSKWGYTYTADWQVEANAHEIKDHTYPVLVRQFAESKSHLGGHLALYQIHSATPESGVLDNHAVLEELARLKETGLRIGLSVSGPTQAETLRKARAVLFAGRPLFDCVQATWNLLEPSAGDALREAHDVGMGVIIKEGLANGRLTERNEDPAFSKQRTLLQDRAYSLGTTVATLALAAVLARPWADVVLSGAATVEQLRANLNALAVPWDDGVASSLAELAETPANYWATRSCLAWN